MPSGVDFQALGRLLDNLYLSMNVKCALMDRSSMEVYTSNDRTDFCAAIAATEGGHQRCVQCDREALCEVYGGRTKQYRCHAGLIECAIPVREGGRTVAVILMGQVLDDSPRDEQWARVRERCRWYPDLDDLHARFLKLRRMSQTQLRASTQIVAACISEVRLSGMALAQARDDGDRLDEYLAQRYADHVTLDGACAALAMSKTKLYNLCRKRYGMTFTQAVTDRRVEAAKDLLRSTRQSVARVAEAVGLPDANYFAKVFRAKVGRTPSEYRREW